VNNQALVSGRRRRQTPLNEEKLVNPQSILYLNMMIFHEQHLYHIYNRGNNEQTIFFERDHYLLFLKNIRKFILPAADILAWCLMPNHFHLLIQANEHSVKKVKQTPVVVNALTEGIRLTLSSYTKALQKQRNFTGSLFQQKTKSKCVNDGSIHYGITAFYYIHQNAYKAGLVQRIEDWEFSSIQDYLGLRTGTLVNRELAVKYLDLNMERMLSEMYTIIPDSEQKLILKP
jgi:putative transposase